MERVNRQRRGHRLYRKTQWSPGGDAYHDKFRRYGLVVWVDAELHSGCARCGGKRFARIGERGGEDDRHYRSLYAHRPGGERSRGVDDQPDMECVHRQCRGHGLYRQTQRRAGGHADCHELFGYRTVRRNDVQLHRVGERCGEQLLARVGDRKCNDGRCDTALGAKGPGGDGGRGDDDQPDLDRIHRQCRGHRLYRPTQRHAGGHPDQHEFCGYKLVARIHLQLYRSGAGRGGQRLVRLRPPPASRRRRRTGHIRST